MSHAAALRQYRSASAVGAAADASPQKLIEMLYEGALERLAGARGAIQRSDTPLKLTLLGGAIEIVEHLRLCLDRNAGGAIARNLDALYEYMTARLLRANLDNDLGALDEVSGLLREIKSAWDQLPGAR